MRPLSPVFQSLWTEIQQNARMRLLLGAVVGILWLYALLVAQDDLMAVEADVKTAQAALERSRSVGTEGTWRQREQEAAVLLQAMKALTWPAEDPGLAAAEAQDWLRSLASKAGLKVQDVRLVPVELGTAKGAADARSQLRLRVSGEFALLPVGAFLQELGQAERGIVVERLQFKTWTRPTSVDIDLRIRLRTKEAAS